MSLDGLQIVGRGSNNTSYNLTKDQDFAASNAIDFINSDFNPVKYIIGLKGPAGSGKTYVLDYIINKCKYSSSVIKCSTPTHKACRVLSEKIGSKPVYTIQSTFGFRLNMKLENFDPRKPQFDPMASIKLENIKLLIVDEASMLPAKIVTYICNKCKELEIKILFTGDPYQLAPINEKKSIAFERCYAVYELKEIVRQGKDNPISPILELLRYDIQHSTYRALTYINKNINTYNYNDIGQGFSIYNPSNFKTHIDNCFHNENYAKNIDMYRIVCYHNESVINYNNYIRNSIIKDADKNILTKNDLIMSYETIVNEFMESIISNSEEYIIHDITNFVDADYGFKGFLVKFQLVHGGGVTIPLFIIDHRDRPTLVMYYKIISNLENAAKSSTGGTRSSLWKEYYKFKKKYLITIDITDKFGDVLYSRDVDYGFAISVHKSQGSTYETTFVDVNDMVYNRKTKQPYANQDDLLRRLYVGCSRPKKDLIISYGK